MTVHSNFPFAKTFEHTALDEAVTRARWVSSDNTGSGSITQNLTGATQERKSFGVVHSGVKADTEDRSFTVITHAGVKVVAEAVEAIAVGDLLSADGDGKAKKQGAGEVLLGFALEAAEGSGHYVTVMKVS